MHELDLCSRASSVRSARQMTDPNPVMVTDNNAAVAGERAPLAGRALRVWRQLDPLLPRRAAQVRAHLRRCLADRNRQNGQRRRE